MLSVITCFGELARYTLGGTVPPRTDEFQILVIRFRCPTVDSVFGQPVKMHPDRGKERQRQHSVGPEPPDGRRQRQDDGDNERDLEDSAPTRLVLLKAA